MFPGPVSKAITASGASSGRNCGQIRNASDVLQDSPALGIGKQNIIEQWNQRRALAARQHVRRPEVRDHGNAERGSNRLCLARLPCAGKPPPGIRLRARLVIERLPVATNQIELTLCRRTVSCTASAYASPSRQFSRANSAVEVDFAFIAASTARRSAAGNLNPSCASSVIFGRAFSSGAIRTTATSIPSAEVPLITPATVIVFALMLGYLFASLTQSPQALALSAPPAHREERSSQWSR